MDADDSEEWIDVDVSEEWEEITPSMDTTTGCDIIEPHQEFVNIVHNHHRSSGVSLLQFLLNPSKYAPILSDEELKLKIKIEL